MNTVDKPQRFYGTTIVAACFVIQGVGIGSYIAYGVFFPSLLDTFGWSRTTISGASSMAFLLMGFLGILTGVLNDRAAPRFIMTGLVKVGTGAGQLVMPFLAGVCITRLGWRSACAIIGLIVLVFLVGAGQLLRPDPARMGQVPDGGGAPGEAKPIDAESGLAFAEALRSGSFWMLCTLNLLAVASMFVILVHIVPHAADLGSATLQAAGLLSTIGGVSMLGRLSVGFAIDRIGSRKCMQA